MASNSIFSSGSATSFAYTLAKTQLAGQQVQFNLQFNLLQNSLIKQYNAKVEKINATPSSVQRHVDALSKEDKNLVSTLSALTDFHDGNSKNNGTLGSIYDEITQLFATYDQNNTVDSSEVAAFDKKRDDIANRINNLYVYSYNGINDGNVIQYLKQQVDKLKSLELTTGTLDSNSAVTDSLTTLQDQVNTAITVTNNTASLALQQEQTVQAKFASNDAEIQALTTQEQARRQTEITDAKASLSNLLQALSVSFDTNSGLASALSDRLGPVTPAAGSPVNIIA